MEGRSMLVLMMLVGFMLVVWVYSWVVALMFEDTKRLYHKRGEEAHDRFSRAA